MKIKFHREDQWDIRDGAETVLACHMRASDGNRSTRLFAIVKLPRDCGYMVEFGGKWVRQFFAEELTYLRRQAGLQVAEDR